ncbi:LD-carboxypeptidase [Streptomyces sp. OfavH-34-F]|uniref:S66 peptidase family protein n=1 Tax=Streptomyces sp. OfavH-34-F TaxID=2917760 RepID=UPI001EF31D08|nr:S66 peptidase family protein [Streptomyces sp. OfavH-34-F]MCG7525365.1 LD-carboxypeptidase [Streptomyces sp. OfavH-34-F]
MVRPRPLRPGDTIGICAPSMAHAARYPRRRERAVAHLEELGYRVRCGRNWLRDTGHTAGTAAERAADLHELYADDRVRAVMTSIGGYNANQLLDLLDYDLIRAHPKPLVGYSDTTALLVAIWQRTGTAVVLGPQLLPQWGEAGGSLEYTRRFFQRVLGSPEPLGPVPFPAEQVTEFLPWDEADDRPRTVLDAVPARALRAGRATGFLIGGNLETLLSLAGTPYWPELNGAILLLESTGTDPGRLTAQFTQLRHTGALDRIAGLALGRFTDPEFDRSDTLAELIAGETAGFAGPVVGGLPFGHTDPMLSLPFGARAELTSGPVCGLTVLDGAVSA